jgi:SHS2 domain-containing protein
LFVFWITGNQAISHEGFRLRFAELNLHLSPSVIVITAMRVTLRLEVDGEGRESATARIETSTLMICRKESKEEGLARLNTVTMAHWEHFSHGSDIGIRGIGGSVEEAFVQAALALTAVVADVATVGSQEVIEVRCEAPDLELLFVSWLNAIIYEMAVRKMLFGAFRILVAGGSLSGTLAGERADPERHRVAVEPKGATVTALKVARDQTGQWLAQCVIDV